MPLLLQATAAFGLEAVVGRELTALGLPPTETEDGRVRFEGEPVDLVRANLWLRAADRVQVVAEEFDCTDFDQFFEVVGAIDWTRWIPYDAAFPITARSVRSALGHVPTLQSMAKKAIAEALCEARGDAPGSPVPEVGPPVPIEVNVRKDHVSLLLDTTGPGLHKRGYRDLSGPAPMKETLAAGIVLLSVWDRERPLLDPCCGTGTLPIEAALIGRNMAPGLQREFVAEGWPLAPPDLWAEQRAAATEAALPPLDSPLQGGDLDRNAVSAARHHAERAGVGDDIHFQQRPIAEAGSKGSHGVLLANPPYGERLGDADTVHQDLAALFNRLEDWSAAVLTPHPAFATMVGRKANRRRKLYNGTLACTLHQYLGPKPPSLTGSPV
ncbi:THUMP domain-containing class I SAM-dependent RNA methyltransferase [Alienimonas chondri]|uniref:Ribosomal RNA large subunit methyltransferase K/L n=1 Tax=Alienimonas chondri TaxID=2681879 RepID=A0ABX1V707_9PLAN|nr:class I SAM-dependent RNA methyltransferase [Alienimonas chondri]NNJ24044.1 Ribosomal RNA large subunit methyltransferase K/L [Alienimonas chondri]